MSKKDLTKTAAQERNGNRGSGGRKQTLSSRVEESVNTTPSIATAAVDRISDRLPTTMAAKQKSPKIDGNFDDIDLRGVSGWAYDANNPTLRVEVEVLVDGRVAGIK